MRCTRILAIVAGLAILSACTSDIIAPRGSTTRPAADGGGYMGTGNYISPAPGSTGAATDSASARGGTGYMGSGN